MSTIEIIGRAMVFLFRSLLLKNVEKIPILKLDEKTLIQFLDNYLRLEVYCLIKFTDKILKTDQELKDVLNLFLK